MRTLFDATKINSMTLKNRLVRCTSCNGCFRPNPAGNPCVLDPA